ncbi:sensor histidine kinase [Thiovibrio sp. JS02]
MPRSIADKISLAALSLTMAVVLALGAASYLFTRQTIKGQIEEKLSFEASLLGNRLETRLAGINDDMRDMAANLIMVNALIDSTGRDMYVEPFLSSYRLPHQIPCLLTLCDFEGKPLVSCEEQKPFLSYTAKSLLSEVIDGGRPLALLRKTDPEITLLIAQPVFYGATGRAEGMLVMELPFFQLVTSCLPDATAAEAKIFTLSGSPGEIWTNRKGRPVPGLSTTVPLKTEAPLDRLALAITVGQSLKEAYAPLTALTGIYLAIGLAVLIGAVAVSRSMARQLTSPLLALTRAADQVTKNGTVEAQISVTSNDEITQLASSFNTMLARLQESHDLLEQRVADRTNELERMNRKLAAEIRERIQAEAKSSEYAETQAVLLREVNHRVKNNLIAIIGMLHQEEDRAGEKGMHEHQRRIQEMVWRVAGLLTVHRLLSSVKWQPLLLTNLCESIIRETLKGLSAASAFSLSVSPSEIRVDSDQAHSLAMIVNELCTNTMKYALRGRSNGAIAVSVRQVADGIELTYHDDGPGFPEPLLRGDYSESGIGITLLNGLVTRNLQGALTLTNENGAVARLTFPAAAPAPAS